MVVYEDTEAAKAAIEWFNCMHGWDGCVCVWNYNSCILLVCR